MASEDQILAINQNRIGEAEGPDAVGDPPDLFARSSDETPSVVGFPVARSLSQETSIQDHNEIQLPGGTQ
jgi:hypothetical protein